MPLILLYLGDEVKRFSSEDYAKKEGSRLHAAENPARIEITPDQGGKITSLKFDATQSAWLTDHHD